jgi:glycosyltransferase involved in cell wall biosynthesis
MTAKLFSGAAPQPVCRVSVVIKALNEEKRISATIQTALQAVASVGGEVILADSCSTDRTVELAQGFPIRIVQLVNAEERCCGAGPQLGYQHSQGEFVYILDGDMEMKAGFFEAAIAFLAEHPEAAGVAGRVVEQNTDSLEYIARNDKFPQIHQPTQVESLDMGGFYRRSAIDAAGYFSNRNLHSYEEFDLAVRLRSLGWTLWRLPVDAVNHYGHDAPPYQLLMRRWRTRYICGLGEMLRASATQSNVLLVLRDVRELRLYAAVVAWWLVLMATWLWHLPVGVRAAIFASLLMAPLLLMAWRKRSMTRAVFSLVSWNFNAAGLLRGLLTAQRPADQVIASRIIREPGMTAVQTAAGTSP